MLRSFRELEKFRLCTSEGVNCGRIKDLYFDDQTWAIKFIVIALEPRQFGHKQVLIQPAQIACVWRDAGVLQLSLSAAELPEAPLATSVLPVCRQYASMALASPGATRFARHLSGADPYLRSIKAVANYRVNVSGEFGGTLADFVLDDEGWQIRYLEVAQEVEHRKVFFHVLPQAVERFTWATQRVLLRSLEPVELESKQSAFSAANAA